MAKKQATKQKHEQVDFRFFRSPAGYFFTTVTLWVISYILASLAIDSGSLLEWITAIIALVWGLVRFVQGIRLIIKK